MRRLLIVATAAVLMASAAGCGCCSTWFRGAPAQPACPAACVSSGVPCGTCDTCTSGAPALVSPVPQGSIPGAQSVLVHP
ncbi:MAG: hypothetical protein ABSF26_05130 [Thermoguttaceae bacterium]